MARYLKRKKMATTADVVLCEFFSDYYGDAEPPEFVLCYHHMSPGTKTPHVFSATCRLVENATAITYDARLVYSTSVIAPVALVSRRAPLSHEHVDNAPPVVTYRSLDAWCTAIHGVFNETPRQRNPIRSLYCPSIDMRVCVADMISTVQKATVESGLPPATCNSERAFDYLTTIVQLSTKRPRYMLDEQHMASIRETNAKLRKTLNDLFWVERARTSALAVTKPDTKSGTAHAAHVQRVSLVDIPPKRFVRDVNDVISSKELWLSSL